MTEFNAQLVALTKLSSQLQQAHATARSLGLTQLADMLHDEGRDVAAMIGRHVVSHGLAAAVDVQS